MKKLSGFLMVLMVIFAIPFFSACNEAVYKVSLVEINGEDQNLTMAIGATYQLRYEVLPSEVNDADKAVTFTSSNTDCVTVSNAGIVTARYTTTAPVTISVASVQNPNAVTNTCQVTVVATKTTLTAPSNLHFDDTNSCVAWDAVTVTGYTPTYEVTFVSGSGVSQQIKKVNTTSTVCTDFDAGIDYTVSVRTLGNNVLYENSASSNSFSFVKLETPDDLAISTTGSTTSTDARVTVVKFTTSRYAYIVQDGINDLLSNYNVVMKTGKNKISLSGTNLTLWNEAVSNATFEVVDENSCLITIIIPDSLTAGTYHISVQAKGDSSTIFNSNVSNYVSFQKLGAPGEMILSGTDAKTLTWSTVSGATGYKIVFKYKLGLADAGSGYEYSSDYIDASATYYTLSNEILETDYSEFYIYMYAMGNGLTIIDSIMSIDNARSVLGQVQNLVLGNRTASDDIVVSWDSVVNAGSYLVTVYYNNDEVYSVLTSELNYTFGVDEQISSGESTVALWSAGASLIKVSALPTANSTYIQGAESEGITVTKLANPTSLAVKNGILTWTAITGSAGYSLTINNNQETISLSSDITSFELTAENYSDYYDALTGTVSFKLTAKGATTNNTNKIDSDSVTINAIKLRTPSAIQIVDGALSFTGNDIYGASLPVQSYVLVIERENSTTSRYVFETKEFSMNAIATLKSYLSSLNTDYTYYFKIKAKGDTENSTYLLSEFSDYISVHFVASPTNLRTKNGVLNWTAPLDSMIENASGKLNSGISIKYEITTNKDASTYLVDAVDEEGYLLENINYVFNNNTFSDNAQPTIYVRVVVTNEGTPTVYLLNSNKINATFWQLPKVTGVYLNSNVLIWESVAQASKYLVVLDENTDIENQIEVTDGTTVNLAESDFEGVGSHTVVIYAFGDNNNKLTSYTSSVKTIQRLDTPTVSIENGLIKWTQVNNADGSTVSTYIVHYTNSMGQKFTKTVSNSFSTSMAGVPAGSYTNVYVIANAEKTNTLSTSQQSAMVNAVDFTKLSKVSLANINVNAENSSGVQWDAISVGIDKCLQYTCSIYTYSSTGIKTLAETKTVNILSSSTYAAVQFSNDYSGGKYEIVVTALGGSVDQNGLIEGDEGWINFVNADVSNAAIIQRISAPIDVRITDNSVYWTSVEGPNATVTSNIRYKIFIYKSFNGVIDSLEYLGTMNAVDPTGFTVQDSVNGVPLSNLYTTEDSASSYYINPGSTIRIYVYAILDNTISDVNVISATDSESGTRELVLDSKNSSVYTATLFACPSVTVSSEGMLSWESNKLFKGVELSFFEYDTDTSTISNTETYSQLFGYSSTTYDLSNGSFSDSAIYIVKVRAIGNDADKQSSALITSPVAVSKLSPLEPNTTSIADWNNIGTTNGWYVQNGLMKWTNIDGVTAYNITYTQDDTSNTYVENNIIPGIYSYNPSCETGEVGIQFSLVGGMSETTITSGEDSFTVGYINSIASSVITIKKLTSATELRVTSGEVEWGVRDVSDNRIGLETDQLGATAVTNYVVDLVGSEVPALTLGINDQYIMSDRDLEEGKYSVQVSSIGNNWMGTADLANGRTSLSAYLNSNASSTLVVQVYSNDIDVKILDGELVWDYNSTHSNVKYKLELTGKNGTEDETLYTTQKYETLASYIGSYSAIKVRFEGVDSDTGKAIPVVNSAYSSDLLNVVKLPNLPNTNATNTQPLYINNYGEIEWRYNLSNSIQTYGNPSNYDIDLYSNILVQMVNPSTNVLVTSTSTTSAYDYNTYLNEINKGVGSTYLIDLDFAGYIGSTSPRYDVSIFVNGSADSSGGAEDSYLNSNTATISAYQFDTIASFTTDEMILNLLWDINSSNIVVSDGGLSSHTEKADLIMLEYKLSTDSVWSQKLIYGEDIDNISQFLPYGIYDFRISVLTQDQSQIRSVPLRLNGVTFTKFAQGDGSRTNPFEIDNSTRLSYMYYLLSSNFELTTDIDLNDLTEGETTNMVGLSNSQFAGGLNGNGYKIRNIQYNGANDFALFDSIMGSDFTGDDIISNDTFENKKGIILNLTMEINSMNYQGITSTSYKGIFTNFNYGYIVNCTSRVETLTDGTNYLPVIDKSGFTGLTMYLGGIAGYNGPKVDESAETEYTFEGVGMISGCTNLLSLDLSTSTNLIYVGGITGYNWGGQILNCVNGAIHSGNYNSYNSGNIKGNEAGGIACINMTIKPIGGAETEYVYSCISGCINYGTITATPIIFGGELAGGGIAGENDAGIITFSANYGMITAAKGTNSTGLTARIGGIIGSTGATSYLSNCFNNGIITVDTNNNEITDNYELLSSLMGALIGYSSASSLVQYSVYNTSPALGSGSVSQYVETYTNDDATMERLNNVVAESIVDIYMAVGSRSINTRVADYNGLKPVFIASGTTGVLTLQYE